MLYRHQTDPPQVRHHCRNPRCAGKLKIPAENPRDAFCCCGCEQKFYSRRCRICERLFEPKTKRRAVCGRSPCRHEFQRSPEKYFGTRYPRAGLGHNRAKEASGYPSGPLGHNASRNPIKTGIKIDDKSGRGYRQVAGPALTPRELELATIGADQAPASAANAAFIKHRRELAARQIFQRTTMPVNVVGGHKFPDAPMIDLGSTLPTRPTVSPASRPAGAASLDDGLGIPEFLERGSS
jgi:hypothetical protein